MFDIMCLILYVLILYDRVYNITILHLRLIQRFQGPREKAPRAHGLLEFFKNHPTVFHVGGPLKKKTPWYPVFALELKVSLAGTSQSPQARSCQVSPNISGPDLAATSISGKSLATELAS